MTEPTHLRLANGWTVTIQGGLPGRFLVLTYPSTISAEPIPRVSVSSITELLPFLREAAALEPPR